jgi:hypothetical protein
VGVIPPGIERIWSALLNVLSALLDMLGALLDMLAALLEMLATLLVMLAPLRDVRAHMLRMCMLPALAGRVWQARSRQDTSSKNGLLDLRGQRLWVQKDRLSPLLLCRVHERIAAVDLRQHLGRHSVLSIVRSGRILNRAGRDWEVWWCLVIMSRQLLRWMVMMRCVRIGGIRVS